MQKKRILMVHDYHKRQEAQLSHRVAVLENQAHIQATTANGFKIVKGLTSSKSRTAPRSDDAVKQNISISQQPVSVAPSSSTATERSTTIKSSANSGERKPGEERMLNRPLGQAQSVASSTEAPSTETTGSKPQCSLRRYDEPIRMSPFPFRVLPGNLSVPKSILRQLSEVCGAQRQ